MHDCWVFISVIYRGDEDLWIGLHIYPHYLSHTDIWIDGTSFIYDNWGPINPNSYHKLGVDYTCGKIDDDGDWEDDTCDSQHGFICKYRKYTGLVIEFCLKYNSLVLSFFRKTHQIDMTQDIILIQTNRIG